MITAARTLLFESKSRGHVTQHSLHLLREAARRRANGRSIELKVMLPRQVLDRLPNECLDPWDVQELSEEQCRTCGEGPAFSRAVKRWRLVKREVARCRATHVHWLELDVLQLQLGARMSPGDAVTQSGLLFRPSVHYRAVFGDRPTVRERVRDARKRLVYTGMLANPSLDTVFTFDPWFASFARERFRTGTKVIGVDEPTEPFNALASKVETSAARTVFLLPGSLERRKGVLTALRALLLLPRDQARRVELRLAGQLDPEIRDTVLELIETLDARSAATVKLIDRWLSESELDREYEAADVILLPYQRFVGSSGILTRAMDAARPVITQDYGLLGQLCERKGLGLAVDTRDPGVLAGALGSMARRKGGATLSRGRPGTNGNQFARQVWDGMPGGIA